MPELGKIIIAPAPARADTLQNVDTWARQVEQALHQIEQYLRELAGDTAG